MNYYNEFDPKAAEWLRELIKQKLIPEGQVDERSIADVSADELAGFRQCHFFAGIGGWSLALRLAEWPASREVWSGSCPCQPYSVAGKGEGNNDPRDLWPTFFKLIAKRKPECVFGEQVEGAVKYGWLDRVYADMEGEGYAVASIVLGAHSVGSPHIRQRLYWMADAGGKRWEGETVGRLQRGESPNGSGISGMADPNEQQRNGCGVTGQGRWEQPSDGMPSCGLAYPDGGSSGNGGLQPGGEHGQQPEDSGTSRVGNAGLRNEPERPRGPRRESGERSPVGQQPGTAGPSHWSDFNTIHCGDGKYRRVPPVTQPCLFPLAYGVSGRVDMVRAIEGYPAQEVRPVSRTAALRGAGNAIVPQVAAEFIRAYLEVSG